MPADVEVANGGAALYKAARFWGFAADEWGLAADWLAVARLRTGALGWAYGPSNRDFIEVYNGCVTDFEELVRKGAENLHNSAAALRTSANEYYQVDDDLRERIDRVGPEIERPPQPDPGPAFGVPH